jgi:GTP cyclohydrolase FolE2
MSRFEQLMNEAVDEVVIGEALVIEALAERIARGVVARQGALRSEVTIRAGSPVARRTPITGIPTQGTCELRAMVRGTLERLPGLPDEAFLHARQVNFETIHAHDVEAERSGTPAEVRAELAGGRPPSHHTTLAEWLHGRG